MHCGKGSDRTGLIVALILELLGAVRTYVLQDYLLTAARLRSQRARDLGRRDDTDQLGEIFKAAETTPERSLIEFLTSIDARTELGDAGLTPDALSALKDRLIDACFLSDPEVMPQICAVISSSCLVQCFDLGVCVVDVSSTQQFSGCVALRGRARVGVGGPGSRRGVG